MSKEDNASTPKKGKNTEPVDSVYDESNVALFFFTTDNAIRQVISAIVHWKAFD